MADPLLRSDIASKVEGHLSQVVKILLVSIFCNNCCIGDVGLQLEEPDGTPAAKRLRMKLGCFIMDGSEIGLVLQRRLRQ